MKILFTYNPSLLKLGGALRKLGGIGATTTVISDHKYLAITFCIIGAIGEVLTYLYGRNEE